MGTRGFFGFYYKGKYYLVYNHYDSYPEALGANLVKEIKKAIDEGRLSEWQNKLNSIKVVTSDVVPTSDDVKLLKPYTNLQVGTQSHSDWYCLLRECQGSLEKVLSSGYLFSMAHTPEECMSDWTEYGYVVDLDHNKFNVYYCGDGTTNSHDFTNLPKFY